MTPLLHAVTKIHTVIKFNKSFDTVINLRIFENFATKNGCMRNDSGWFAGSRQRDGYKMRMVGIVGSGTGVDLASVAGVITAPGASIGGWAVSRVE